jgi:uncharacterized protein (DUF2147 family)
MRNKKTNRPLLSAALLAGLTAAQISGTFAQASSPDEITGVWETESRNFKFEMFDAGESYSARIIFGDRLVEADGKTFKKDIHNPDPKLRGRSLKGIVFLPGLKWDKTDRRWEDGRLYDGSSGRTYSGRASLVEGNLELRGYAGVPLLGQTLLLQRVP